MKLKPLGFLFALLAVIFGAMPAAALTSEDTNDCFGCHILATPGIVEDWKRSLHAAVSPKEGLSKSLLERRISAEKVADKLADITVGCAECHTMNADNHPDTFEHNGYQVHVVVTPEDCATCHPVERSQYGGNLMSHAYGNLKGNPVFHDLSHTVNGSLFLSDGRLSLAEPDDRTDADSCYYCHGTLVEKTGMRTRKTTVGGELSFPVLSGWPNQGVGRVNPDGSLGTCSACHARHQFSIEVARKPATCSECHKGPDVPAYAAYLVSKHGNIYSALEDSWDFTHVPWQMSRDFTAPTCAACHVSLLTDNDNELVVERTHTMGDRSAWRLMGLVYATPHPKSPDTSIIRNKGGLPLPSELTGEPAAEFLIDGAEQARRRGTMIKVCNTCHSLEWIEGQFARLENTIKTTNEATLTATKILLTAWDKGAANGPAKNDSIFNEALEKKWVEQWLFYANSCRYATAMIGADYGVFANGRWYLNKNLQEMSDWLEFKLKSSR